MSHESRNWMYQRFVTIFNLMITSLRIVRRELFIFFVGEIPSCNGKPTNILLYLLYIHILYIYIYIYICIYFCRWDSPTKTLTTQGLFSIPVISQYLNIMLFISDTCSVPVVIFSIPVMFSIPVISQSLLKLCYFSIPEMGMRSICVWICGIWHQQLYIG